MQIEALKNWSVQCYSWIPFFLGGSVSGGEWATIVHTDISVENTLKMWQCFFVASYVVTDKNKLTEREVDNDIPH